jgi:RNA polymerase-binding transcription factor DksA
MTPAEMERFRIRLEQEYTRLREQLATLEQQLDFNETGDVPSDPADAATVLLDQEELLGQTVQLQAIAVQIEKALARIAEGTYGMSEVSGKPIPIERLEALPYASTLVDEEAPGG